MVSTLSACQSENSDADNGVNDVRAACEIRAAWKNRNAEKCGLCPTAAIMPACGCASFEGFDGVCASQGAARRAEASCTETLEQCVNACGADCGCVDLCYAAAPACRQASAARDGCVAEKCSAYCN